MRWEDTRVLVTGGAGFLGSFVVDKLRERGCRIISVPRSREYDLRDRDAVIRLYDTSRPHIVVHLAALVGGIGANLANPGRFFYDNAVMGLQLMEYARRFGVGKFVAVGTVCAYPKFTPVPFKESDLWKGYPRGYECALRTGKKDVAGPGAGVPCQYGFNAIYLLPVNLYGPRDNFDLETGHVIPSLIRKCQEAKEWGDREIVLWGDGSPTREFLYVEDAAEGIVLAAERYDEGDPVDLGSGEEISIKALAELIAETVGFTGRVEWDTTKPNGQPRRCLDIERAQQRFGFRATCTLENGIRSTPDWFLAHRPIHSYA